MRQYRAYWFEGEGIPKVRLAVQGGGDQLPAIGTEYCINRLAGVRQLIFQVTGGNVPDAHRGIFAQGQQVFVDTGTKVVSIVQGESFVSVFRITRWLEFANTMIAKGLQLANGVTYEGLQQAMGLSQ